MTDGKRRFPRFPANLRLRLRLPGGELETSTEEISLGGFSAPCAPAPEGGARLGFVLHLPDGREVAGDAEVVRAAEGGLCAFEATFTESHTADWAAFVEQERASGGLWRMIGRYAVNAGQEKEAARSVLERGPLGILFKRIGGPAADGADAPVSTRFHMVGENGEAWRVAFEKHPAHLPDASDLAGLPGFLELATLAVARLLPQDVLLKRSPQGQASAARVVELKKGGFAIVVVHPNAAPSFAGLHGAELLAVEVDGKPVFPFFDAADLDRIALDNFRRDEEKPAPAAVPLKEERFAASYAHKELATGELTRCTQRDVRDAMARAQRVQTRRYGDRAIRLFPELWLEVMRPGAWPGAVRGFAMEDGPTLCLFVLVGPDAPRVLALEPADAIAVIRGDAQT